MHTLKLHVKTTLLASAITIAMLITALVVTSAGIATLERSDDKALAEIQAIDLARHVSDMRRRVTLKRLQLLRTSLRDHGPI